jgi:hypothetical protein
MYNYTIKLPRMYGYHIPAAVFISVPTKFYVMKMTREMMATKKAQVAIDNREPIIPSKMAETFHAARIARTVRTKYARPSVRVAGLEPSSINPRHW